MIYRKPAPPDSLMVPTPYEFLEPVRVKVRYPDGREVLMGYGIGETVMVMAPDVRYAVCCSDLLEEIPLADGSHIVEFPSDMRTRIVWPNPKYDRTTDHYRYAP
jgi:hypothetical protein